MDYLDWMTYGGLLLMVLGGGFALYSHKKTAKEKPQEHPDDHDKAK